MYEGDEALLSREQIEQEINNLVDRADLGVKCKKFIDSDEGQYLIERAVLEERRAIEDFKTMNLYDADAIKEVHDIQFKLKVPNLMFAWLKEAFTDGEKAFNDLEKELVDE